MAITNEKNPKKSSRLHSCLFHETSLSSFSYQTTQKSFVSHHLYSVLFKKDLLIEQAMINLYTQIQVDGIFFFCPYISKKKELRYSFIKPDHAIKDVYDKFGKSGYLTLVYSDRQLGMQRMLNLQKWVLRILCFVGLLYIMVYGYSYFLYYTKE